MTETRWASQQEGIPTSRGRTELVNNNNAGRGKDFACDLCENVFIVWLNADVTVDNKTAAHTVLWLD